LTCQAEDRRRLGRLRRVQNENKRRIAGVFFDTTFRFFSLNYLTAINLTL